MVPERIYLNRFAPTGSSGLVIGSGVHPGELFPRLIRPQQPIRSIYLYGIICSLYVPVDALREPQVKLVEKLIVVGGSRVLIESIKVPECGIGTPVIVLRQGSFS